MQIRLGEAGSGTRPSGESVVRGVADRQLRQVASDFGLTLEELRELLWHPVHGSEGADSG